MRLRDYLDNYPQDDLGAQLIRTEILTTRKFLRDAQLNRPVDLKEFLLFLETITLSYQEVLPELALRLDQTRLIFAGQMNSLLELMSRYHALAFHPYLDRTYLGYVEYYLDQIRPLLFKLLLEKIDEQKIGLTIPSSSFTLEDDDIPF
ncbi:hypothetical protein ACQ4M3_09275 [Leptolyngbya sp. AN03gr2]|uniref:hypothetical protein n=1 Tax=Leptolyngbya sp. AN03gr2 TaxID=3423364 RepID=UPI003D3149DA